MIVLHEEGHLDCNEVAAATAFRNPKIDFVWNSTLEEIKGRDEVEGLVIKNVVTGASSEVETDGIFFFVGMIPQTELVRDLVECDDKGYIAVNEKKETSVPGIYAVGDCTQTFLRQVVTAAADGAIAATASERYVKEKKQIDSLLTPDAGKVAFVFYDPYDSEQIEQVSALEEKLRGEWRVERQDITRQSLLYRPPGAHGLPRNRLLLRRRQADGNGGVSRPAVPYRTTSQDCLCIKRIGPNRQTEDTNHGSTERIPSRYHHLQP